MRERSLAAALRSRHLLGRRSPKLHLSVCAHLCLAVLGGLEIKFQLLALNACRTPPGCFVRRCGSDLDNPANAAQPVLEMHCVSIHGVPNGVLLNIFGQP